MDDEDRQQILAMARQFREQAHQHPGKMPESFDHEAKVRVGQMIGCAALLGSEKASPQSGLTWGEHHFCERNTVADTASTRSGVPTPRNRHDPGDPDASRTSSEPAPARTLLIRDAIIAVVVAIIIAALWKPLSSLLTAVSVP